MIITPEAMQAFNARDRHMVDHLCALSPSAHLSDALRSAMGPNFDSFMDFTTWTLPDRCNALSAAVLLAKVARGRPRTLVLAVLFDLADFTAGLLIKVAPNGPPPAWALN